jgi:hypothetical protein
VRQLEERVEQLELEKAIQESLGTGKTALNLLGRCIPLRSCWPPSLNVHVSLAFSACVSLESLGLTALCPPSCFVSSVCVVE